MGVCGCVRVCVGVVSVGVGCVWGVFGVCVGCVWVCVCVLIPSDGTAALYISPAQQRAQKSSMFSSQQRGGVIGFGPQAYPSAIRCESISRML